MDVRCTGQLRASAVRPPGDASMPGLLTRHAASRDPPPQGKRYSMPNARIMIHQPLGGASGAAVDIEIQVRCAAAGVGGAAGLALRECLPGAAVWTCKVAWPSAAAVSLAGLWAAAGMPALCTCP